MHRDTPGEQDLDAAVAAARRVLEPPPTPAVSLALRLKTSPAARAIVPTRLAISYAASRGQRRWESSAAEREEALAVMDAIVGNTARESEATQLARRHLIEDEIHKAFFWQRWPTERMDAASTEHLERTLASSRAVILSSCHLGPFHHHTSPISARGRTIYIVSGKWFFDDPSADYWGRRIARWWVDLVRRDVRLVSTVRSFPVLRRLLVEGETVLIYFDMPGSRRTSFLGKPVMLATGTAKLAVEADALVLPLRARRVGHRVWTDVAEPLDPRDFSGFEDLHEALAALHERWILEQPETLEDPGRPGSWEGLADRDEWARG